VDFAHAPRTHLPAAFQFLDGGRAESRLVVARQIQTTPHLKAIRILRILMVDIIKLCAGSHGKDDSFLNANLIHVLDPFLNLLRSLGVRMRVHVDDGIFGLVDLRDGNFIDRFRAVVIEENCLW
jgi:hypothetical protein